MIKIIVLILLISFLACDNSVKSPDNEKLLTVIKKESYAVYDSISNSFFSTIVNYDYELDSVNKIINYKRSLNESKITKRGFYFPVPNMVSNLDTLIGYLKYDSLYRITEDVSVNKESSNLYPMVNYKGFKYEGNSKIPYERSLITVYKNDTIATLILDEYLNPVVEFSESEITNTSYARLFTNIYNDDNMLSQSIIRDTLNGLIDTICYTNYNLANNVLTTIPALYTTSLYPDSLIYSKASYYSNGIVNRIEYYNSQDEIIIIAENTEDGYLYAYERINESVVNIDYSTLVIE